MTFPPTSSQRTLDDPARMSPDERLSEVAAILARGVLRLRWRAAAAPEDSTESCRKSLASGRKTSPDVSCG